MRRGIPGFPALSGGRRQGQRHLRGLGLRECLESSSHQQLFPASTRVLASTNQCQEGGAGWQDPRGLVE